MADVQTKVRVPTTQGLPVEVFQPNVTRRWLLLLILPFRHRTYFRGNHHTQLTMSLSILTHANFLYFYSCRSVLAPWMTSRSVPSLGRVASAASLSHGMWGPGRWWQSRCFQRRRYYARSRSCTLKPRKISSRRLRSHSSCSCTVSHRCDMPHQFLTPLTIHGSRVTQACFHLKH